jgi:hypothetical protein
MTYQPNFSDPRVKARCQRAIGFVCGVMSDSKPMEWSSRYIDKYMGSSNHPLSRYLRDHLLICTDDYYRYNSNDRGICKKYLLNKDGLDSLRENLKLTHIQTYPSVAQVAKTDHNSELTTGLFEYTDKSNRLWHPLQRYRKQYKKQILADHGYPHQYDIECCAPTLIHQHSQQIPEVLDSKGVWQQGPMDLWLFALQRYLKDRRSVRQELADQLELPEAAVKEVINALFAGAVISKHKDSDIFHILAGDLARIEWLKQNTYMQELISDIKCCWTYIRPTMQLRTKQTQTGQVRRLPITAKQKWLLYFELERSVIDSVRTYLDQRSIRYFLEHDGWSSSEELDQNELRDHIYKQTGFRLKFEYENLTHIQTYPSVAQVENLNQKEQL